jgi:hypothetical protein
VGADFLSRLFLLVDAEKVAGDSLEDQFLQPIEIKEAVVESLLTGRVEGFFGIGALEVEETSEGSHSPAVGSFLDLSHIEIESLRVCAKLFFFETGTIAGRELP